MAVVCSDGTWMAPSDVHVQTTGAWKEGEMARDPGGLLRRSLPGASNGAGRLQMAPNEQRGSRQPLSQTRPSRRSSQGRRAWLAAVARKIAERGCRKATPFGAGNRPTHGCGVGTRAPVAPSPALPAGLSALAASERRMDADPRQMESGLGVRRCPNSEHSSGIAARFMPAAGGGQSPPVKSAAPLKELLA